MPELSIILVNWNCLEFTLQCIQSVQESTLGIDYEVIVVDNASTDAPCRELAERFPWVKLILSDQNLGFGRANNLGVKHAGGKYFLFLNPDTLVKTNAISRMLGELASRSQAGAIGCKLLNPDGSLQTTCTFAFPTIANQLLGMGWLQRRWPKLSIWGRSALYANDAQSIHVVDVAPGAAIMVTRQAFESAGGFNPEYFMYAEEVDLCFAIRRRGYAVLHVSDTSIIHFGGQSTNKCEDGFSAVLMCDSVFRFFRRAYGPMYAILYRILLSASAFSRIAVLACAAPLLRIFRKRSNREFVVIAKRKWVKIALWSIGWNRPHQKPLARVTVP